MFMPISSISMQLWGSVRPNTEHFRMDENAIPQEGSGVT